MNFERIQTVVKLVIIPSIISVILYVLIFKVRNEKISAQKSYDLVIAVLSARQNIVRRQIIRNTWAKNIPKNIKLFFILGTRDCLIHPEDRKDNYSCEEMRIDSQDLVKQHHYTTHSIALKNPVTSQLRKMYSCFTFVVHHPIRIQKLGILTSLLSVRNSITVQLLQGTSGEVIVKGTLQFTNDTANMKNGFLYVDVEEFVYPRGFEGIIQTDIFELEETLADKVTWKNVDGVISFKDFCIASISESDYTFIKLSNDLLVSSFKFIIHDLPVLKSKFSEINSRGHLWNKFTTDLTELIIKEQNISGDLVFTDLLDIYRNLPKKLILFYNWLTKHSQINYKYLLKTDDDTILIIDKIFYNLNLLPEKNVWWGKFRKYWIVNHFGKWTEQDYSSSVYPSFACGGGNVLSCDLVSWISENYQKLHIFQGEDVSVGIWLSVLNPQLLEDDRWSCDDSCSKDSFNRVQMSEKQMSRFWALYSQCGSICYC